jgi:hypothetical protein
MQDKITKEKIEKYKALTGKALTYAREIVSMVENYLSDAGYFEEKEDFVSCFAALNYAHGWIDAGVRLDVFKVKDNKLFTVK